MFNAEKQIKRYENGTFCFFNFEISFCDLILISILLKLAISCKTSISKPYIPGHYIDEESQTESGSLKWKAVKMGYEYIKSRF